MVLRPGDHYTVVESSTGEYHTFPEAPQKVYAKFRHAWVLVRNKRPYVPVLEGAPLPSPARRSEDNAKYFSVFFRPWTLLAGSEDVPELQHLGIPPAQLRGFYDRAPAGIRRRLRGPQPPPQSIPTQEAQRWAAAWEEYLRGSRRTGTGLTALAQERSSHDGAAEPPRSALQRWGSQRESPSPGAPHCSGSWRRPRAGTRPCWPPGLYKELKHRV